MRFMMTAAILGSLLAAPALAQTPATPAATPGAAAMTQIPAGHIRAESLIDRDVYATDNVEIGEVQDLIIDPQGRVAMVVIEVENRLGLTQKYVSVPMERLRAVPGERRVTINMASAEIRSLPAVNY